MENTLARMHARTQSKWANAFQIFMDSIFYLTIGIISFFISFNCIFSSIPSFRWPKKNNIVTVGNSNVGPFGCKSKTIQFYWWSKNFSHSHFAFMLMLALSILCYACGNDIYMYACVWWRYGPTLSTITIIIIIAETMTDNSVCICECHFGTFYGYSIISQMECDLPTEQNHYRPASIWPSMRPFFYQFDGY